MSNPQVFNFDVGAVIKSFRAIQMTANARTFTSRKIAAVSVTFGIILLGILASYLKRRRGSKSKHLLKKYDESSFEESRQRSPSIRSIRRQGSVLSGISVTSEQLSRRGLLYETPADLTPQQLGVMGMESLEASINYWEDAMGAYREKNVTANTLAITGEEDSEFCRELQKLLKAAYKLQDECELLFLDQRSVLFRPEGSTRVNSESEYNRGDFSPAESFVSAQDAEGWQMADLREFDEYLDLNVDVEQLSLYQNALKRFEDDGIPYRCLRTEMVRCSSDVEYLCKLHCIRVAFQWLFSDKSNWEWFANAGRQMLVDLLLCAGKDPKEFLIAYENMMIFLQENSSWIDIEMELTARGVKAMTFYDIVLDYILMDAFEDLDTPPASVMAVVQNRWLSDGFKESALTTAVWSVLKAKRRMLKFQNGFMAHFYSISEKLSPLMAWGFLGPNEELKAICVYFKEQVIEFLTDIFSFQRTKYTSVQELAKDLISHSNVRIDNISNKLRTKLSTVN